MTMENLTSTEWNIILRKQRIPLMVITLIFFVIGFAGNAIVIAVYKLRMRSSHGRYFIPYLASADMCATSMTSVFMMILDFTEGVFPSDQLCKAFQFLNWSTTQASVFLLFVIAVHRYLSVCRPLDIRVTKLWQKIAVGGSVICAYLLGIPLLTFSGSVSFKVNYKGANVTGTVCNFNPGRNKLGEAIYYNFLFVGNILLLLATTALYIPIGRVIFQKFKSLRLNKASVKNETPSKTVDLVSINQSKSSIEYSAEDMSSESASVASAKMLSTKIYVNNNEAKNTKPEQILQNFTNLLQTKRSSRQRRRSRLRGSDVRSKFTFTLMLVVIFYVISYIPFYVIISTGINDPNVWYNLSPWKLNGYLFLYRCYIVNHVVNPIIYGLFDSTFRQKLLGLVRKCTSLE